VLILKVTANRQPTGKGQKMELVKDDVMVEWETIGEGLDGDYDPDDSEDRELYRFSVLKYDPEYDLWVGVDDASYCTYVEVGTDEGQLMALLEILMDEVYEPVMAGDSIKKLAERLSWITTEWIKERE